MIVFDEFKSKEELRVWWFEMLKDVSHSYPLDNFSRLDSTFKMNTCVDIGANVGTFSYLASSRFKKVVSFEAAYHTSTAARVAVNTKEKRNNVIIYNLAVGKENGKILKLRCDVHDGKLTSGNASVIYESSLKKYELVPSVDLETVFELAETDFIDYLKIDCEGAEYDILLDKDLSKIGIIGGEIHSHPSLPFPEARKNLLDHLSMNFNIVARQNNFFAVNKKFSINPSTFFGGPVYAT